MSKFDDPDRLFEYAIENGIIPGVVAAVSRGGNTIYEAAFGMADISSVVPMELNSLFSIYSMTKPVTSAAVMMLVEDGKCDLDSPVSEFLTSYETPGIITSVHESDASCQTRPAKGEITVRQMMNHTAGYTYRFFSHELDALMRATGQADSTELPIVFEPGTKWMYGPSTRILGRMVEELSGMNLEGFFRERIFGPLGMDDTYYEIPVSERGRFVKTYRPRNGEFALQPDPDLPMWGDTGLNSTAADYLGLCRMFLNYGELDGARVLGEESVRLMTTNSIGDLRTEMRQEVAPGVYRQFPPGGKLDKFGLGFQITSEETYDGKTRAPGSCTWGGMRNTFFWFDYENALAAVLMMQTLPFYDKSFIGIYHEFEEIVYQSVD